MNNCLKHNQNTGPENEIISWDAENIANENTSEVETSRVGPRNDRIAHVFYAGGKLREELAAE